MSEWIFVKELSVNSAFSSSMNEVYSSGLFDVRRAKADTEKLYLTADTSFYVTDDTSVVFLPWWVVPVMTRNGASLLDVLEYSKSVKTLGVEDMADILCINQYMNVPGISHPSLFRTSSESEQEECMDRVYRRVCEARLAAIDEKFCTDEKKLDLISMDELRSSCYDSKNIEGTIFFILKEFFPAVLRNRSYRVEFYRDYLKELYKQVPIHKVSCKDVFNKYVESFFA